jgi:hypothetical protein
MKSSNIFWKLLLERAQLLTEAKSPAEQAHDLGLEYAGYGYWKDSSGKKVARTIGDKLVKLGNGEEDGPTDTGDDTHAKELAKLGKDALKKLAIHIIENIGKDDDMTPGLVVGVQKDIATVVSGGWVESNSPVFGVLDNEEGEAYKDALAAIASLNNSKLVKAIKVYQQVQKHEDDLANKAKAKPTKQEFDDTMNLMEPLFKNVPIKYHDEMKEWVMQQLENSKLHNGDKPLLSDTINFLESLGMKTLQNAIGVRDIIAGVASQTQVQLKPHFGLSYAQFQAATAPPVASEPVAVPVAAAPSPSPVKNPIDVQKAAVAAGLTSATPAEYAAFIKIMKKAEEAETSVQLNYIGALLKKAGLVGKTPDEQWTNWKTLLKYIKSTKVDLIKGAKEKGKIKNKFSQPDPNFGTSASKTGIVTPDAPQDQDYTNGGTTVNLPPVDVIQTANSSTPEPVTEPTNSDDLDSLGSSFDQLYNQYTGTSATPPVAQTPAAEPEPVPTDNQSVDAESPTKWPEGTSIEDATNTVANLFGQAIGWSKDWTTVFADSSIPVIKAFIADVLKGASSPEDTEKVLANDLIDNEIDALRGVLEDYYDSFPKDDATTTDDPLDKILGNFLDLDLDHKSPHPNEIKLVKDLVAAVLKGDMSFTNMWNDLDNNTHFSDYDLDRLVELIDNAQQGEPSYPSDATKDLALDVVKAVFVAPKTKKAVATSMTAPWSKGDPEKVVQWMLKKYKETNNGAWQAGAMHLVTDYNLPLEKVPAELLPDNVKNALLPPQSKADINAIGQKTSDALMAIAQKVATGNQSTWQSATTPYTIDQALADAEEFEHIHKGTPAYKTIEKFVNGDPSELEAKIKKFSTGVPSDEKWAKLYQKVKDSAEKHKQGGQPFTSSSGPVWSDVLLKKAEELYGYPINPGSAMGKAIELMANGDLSKAEYIANGAPDTIGKVFKNLLGYYKERTYLGTAAALMGLDSVDDINPLSAVGIAITKLSHGNTLDAEELIKQFPNAPSGKALKHLLDMTKQGQQPTTQASAQADNSTLDNDPDTAAQQAAALAGSAVQYDPSPTGHYVDAAKKLFKSGDKSEILNYIDKAPPGQAQELYQGILDQYDKWKAGQSGTAPKADLDSLLHAASQAHGDTITTDSILGELIEKMFNGDESGVVDRLKYYEGESKTHLKAYKAYKAAYDLYKGVTQPSSEPAPQLTPDFDTINKDWQAKFGKVLTTGSEVSKMVQACMNSNSLEPFEKLSQTYPSWAQMHGPKVKDLLSQYINPSANATPPVPKTFTEPDLYDASQEIFAMGGDLTKHLSSSDAEKALKAIEHALKTNNIDPIFDLYNTTGISSAAISILKKAATAKYEELQQAQKDAQIPSHIQQALEKYASPEPDQSTTAVDNTNAIQTSNEEVDDFLTNALNNMKVDATKFSPAAKTELGKAAAKALSSPTEVGVIVAFNKLAKMGEIPESVLTELKYQISEKLKGQGQLYTGPDAFKKTFDYDQFLTDIVSGEVNAPNVSPVHKQAFNNFYNALSDQQKEQLVAAMKHGMNLPTSQQATEYYKQTLGGLPGWNDQVFEAWRRSLRFLHDEFKDAAEMELKKKQELEAQKKAEEELKKVYAALGKVGGAQVVQSILKGAKLDTLPAPSQKQVVDTAVKALAASTTQGMLDQLNTLRGYSAYAHGGTSNYGPLSKQQFEMFRDLMVNVFFDAKYKDKHPTNVPEPKVTTPLKDRLKTVFDKWQKEHGYGLAHVPNNSFQERQKIVQAVTTALQEPDPKMVNTSLNKLVTATSLTDDQIDALRQVVHAERQAPASLTGKVPQLHSPKPHTATMPSVPSGNGGIAQTLKKHPEFLQKLKYYGIPISTADAVHDIMIDGMSQHIHGSTDKGYKSTKIANKLMALGISQDVAKNFGNWTTLQAQKNSDIAQKAKEVKAAQQQSVPGGFGTLPTGTPKNISVKDQVAAKQYVANVKNDPHGYVKNELSKGEIINITQGYQPVWENNTDGDLHHCVTEAVKQEQWRKANLSPEDYKRFSEAAHSWQGSSQWSKSPEHRKAMNTIFTKIIEGPPPQQTKVEKWVERGVSVDASDFGDFIKLFNVGERVYIGPSGFSASNSTAKNFGSCNSLDMDSVKVLLRVKPPASGMIKACRLHNRPGDLHPSETELVLGTNNCTRVSKVIKHVIEYAGKHYVNYEIEMDWDDSLNEGVDTYGFQTQYWKGVSPATIKAIIKYMNSSVHTQY